MVRLSICPLLSQNVCSHEVVGLSPPESKLLFKRLAMRKQVKFKLPNVSNVSNIFYVVRCIFLPHSLRMLFVVVPMMVNTLCARSYVDLTVTYACACISKMKQLNGNPRLITKAAAESENKE
jgi:hypothetical protein